jgi:predicted phosphoribosyltransferase/alpha-beta hydrolase superfamily lysophospholipase
MGATPHRRLKRDAVSLPFRDRCEAGRRLAERLRRYRERAATVVLALPRGGIVPAAEIASALRLPLDVIVSRKLGAPGNPELAIGALAEGGAPYFNEEGLAVTGASEAHLAQEVERQRAEIARRQRRFRDGRPLSLPERATVILIDDGVATGSTAIAAIRALREQGVGRIVFAVPVAPPDTVKTLRRMVDELVVLATPMLFWAVGAFYEDFRQVSDDEVVDLLKRAGTHGFGADPQMPRASTPLHVRHAGEGLPVLFLHAFPLHGGMWRPQLGARPGRARLLAPDLPGCGLSPIPPLAPRSLEDYAREVLAMLDALDVGRVVVVGLGMGGQIALRLVDELGARLIGMLLSGTDARSATDEIAARCHELAAEVESSGVEAAAAEFLPKLLGMTTQRTRPALLDEIHAMIRENTPVGVGAALRAMAARPDATSLLSRIRCPVVCLAGEEDAFTPPDVARATAERLFGGRTEIIPAAGHLTNLEAPEAFNDALQTLLIQCSPV